MFISTPNDKILFNDLFDKVMQY